jgi:hypothetical protein
MFAHNPLHGPGQAGFPHVPLRRCSCEQLRMLGADVGRYFTFV